VKSFHVWTGLIVGGWLTVIGPGSFEGAMFPVVKDVHLSATQDETRPDWSIVSGHFVKIRQDCSPRRIEWFLGNRETNDSPVEYSWGPPQVRLAGEHVFYDWQVRAAPPDVLENETFADVLHRCHIVIAGRKLELPWLTRSRFWN